MNLSSWVRSLLTRKWVQELLAYSGQGYILSFINILVSILLVRFFGREEYGMYGLVFAVSGVITNVCGLGVFPLAMTRWLKDQRPEEERETRAYFSTGLTLALTLSVFALLALFFWYPFSFVVYSLVATVSWFFYNLVPFSYISFVKERRLKGFLGTETIVQLIKTGVPLGVLLCFSFTMTWFFLGLSLSMVVTTFWLGWLATQKRVDLSLFPRRLTYAFLRSKQLFIRGVGIAFESGAATFYASLLFIAASQLGGLGLTADIKVLSGYVATLTFVSTPFSKWVTNHLPQRLGNSTRPWQDMMKWNGIGFVQGLAVYVVGLILAPLVFPLVYGPMYAHLWVEYAKAGLWLVVCGGAVGVSVFSRLQGMGWTFGLLSLTNILLGILLVYLLNVDTVQGLALFYGLWAIPGTLGSYVLSYLYIRRHQRLAASVM